MIVFLELGEAALRWRNQLCASPIAETKAMMEMYDGAFSLKDDATSWRNHDDLDWVGD